MNVEEILKNTFQVKKITESKYQIVTPAEIRTFDLNIEQKYIVLYLDKTEKGYILSDKQYTLKNISRTYELNAQDIKNSIKGITKANGIKIINAMLIAQIEDEKFLQNKIFDMIMCIGQLYKMYVFFEIP